ncbi:phage tail domain-containing protein [Actinomadura sp. WMMB 499]|uniref:phage tail domain-containing protein n=1 Tax=Actinomadura sp. WMMB 499 TaxID=1219491 RepID=UPI0012467F30|nr:phage tail domain-containing protein [Actinomadura sp. WMMB 499]QFG25444.1 hypothetical protein F7P10_34070 [Actinomadura sp. WMMB 499]
MDYLPMVTLNGVDGSQFALQARGSSGNIWLNEGAKGLDMPTYDVQADEFPNVAGSVPRSVRGAGREIFLPLTIWGDTRAEAVELKRRLRRALAPTRMFSRMAKLVVAESNSDGAFEDQREIECYYDNGMEGTEGEENGRNYFRYGLVLQATDPYFRAVSDVRVSFATYGEVRKFFPPEDEPFVSPDGVSGGFKLTASPVFTTNITVTNPGDESAYPTWTIVGPIEGPFNLVRAATAYSDEEVLAINTLSLAEGETATLVTEPGRVSLSTSAGAQAVWSSLAVNPHFWELDPGNNAVSIVGLTGDEPTSVSISFRPKYLGM